MAHKLPINQIFYSIGSFHDSAYIWEPIPRFMKGMEKSMNLMPRFMMGMEKLTNLMPRFMKGMEKSTNLIPRFMKGMEKSTACSLS